MKQETTLYFTLFLTANDFRLKASLLVVLRGGVNLDISGQNFSMKHKGLWSNHGNVRIDDESLKGKGFSPKTTHQLHGK